MVSNYNQIFYDYGCKSNYNVGDKFDVSKLLFKHRFLAFHNLEIKNISYVYGTYTLTFDWNEWEQNLKSNPYIDK
jgi:hypothetical protein